MCTVHIGVRVHVCLLMLVCACVNVCGRECVCLRACAHKGTCALPFLLLPEPLCLLLQLVVSLWAGQQAGHPVQTTVGRPTALRPLFQARAHPPSVVAMPHTRAMCSVAPEMPALQAATPIPPGQKPDQLL